MLKTRVGIVDDHPAVRLGLTAVLNAQDDLHVVASAATARALLEAENRLDLILLDLSLADGSSPAVNMAELSVTGAPVLAYTSGDQPALLRQAARAGVAGMIHKSEPADRIVESVRAAIRGEPVVSAGWAAAVGADGGFVSAELTVRETQVLTLYASGETAERVAERLFVARETITDHIRRIRVKYAAVDRPAPTKVDLFRRAVEDGLVIPEA